MLGNCKERISLVLLSGCMLPMVVGCQMPGSTPKIADATVASPLVTQASHSTGSSELVTPTVADAADPDDKQKPQTDEEALAAALDGLEGIDAIDAATKAELMSDLRKARRENWPLIVHQFQSALAYRRQLEVREMNQALSNEVQGNLMPIAAPQQQLLAPPSQPTSFPTNFPTTTPFPTTSTPGAIPVSFVPVKSQKTTPSPRALGPSMAVVATDAKPTEAEPTEAINAEQFAAAKPLPAPPSMARPKPDRSVQQASYVEIVTAQDDWRGHLNAAIAALSKSAKPVSDSTSDIHEHMRLRMMRLMAGDDDNAMAPIPGASAAEQDYWNNQLFAVSTFLDLESQHDSHRRAAGSLVHLDQARAKLAELATLDVRNLTFVESVDGYGVYETKSKTEFRPGDQVNLYAEVANFRSDSTKEGYRTTLSTSYEVVDLNGQRVDGRQFPDVEDFCKNLRRDFHIQYGVDLPTRIYPGKYKIRLTITDQLSHKIGQTSVPFEIVE